MIITITIILTLCVSMLIGEIRYRKKLQDYNKKLSEERRKELKLP